MKPVIAHFRRGRTRLMMVALLVGATLSLMPMLVQESAAELEGPKAKERQVALAVSKLLTSIHLAQRPLDDEISQRALDSYLKTLDPLKLYFTKADVEEFSASREKIDDQVESGDVRLGYTIFMRFLDRIDERLKLAEEMLEVDHDFTVDEEIVVDRDDLDAPATDAEIRERWRKKVKYDLLREIADDMTIEEAKEKLGKRYRSFAGRMHQIDNDELSEMFLSAITTSYDPHTTYMSPSTLENFRILMSLELEGIGASLKFEDGVTVVHRIIPGGAADKDGRLAVGDHIVSVGQEDDADDDMVDVVNMKLNDVVKLIRGPKDSIVRLGVLPKGKGPQKIYNITRDRIELKDSEARSVIFEEGQRPDGRPFKIGVIDLPSFYMDMSGARLGRENYKSTTRDVRKLLDEFKEQGVDAVIVDLRRNGGGSLTEAINFTGLFIDEGPVVQVKGFNGDVEQYDDRDEGMAWSGPLVVLTSQFSASASEIFAGAIQDYGRGLIVGDHATHGKGTVQQLLDLGHQIFRIPNAPKLGALKVTIQQFYRPSGDSTQSRGVLADLELPSLTTHLEVGENDLDFALAFDKVDKLDFEKMNLVDPNLVRILKSRSEARIKESDDFKKAIADIERYQEQKERDAITLNKEKYLAEREKLDSTKEEEDTLENLNDPDRPVVERDYYFEEALSITLDYINMLERRVAAKN